MTDAAPGAEPIDIDDADEQARRVAYCLKGVVRELTGGWNAWVSQEGGLYATRGRGLSNEQISAGLSMTVYGATAVELVERIRVEMRRESAMRADREAAA